MPMYSWRCEDCQHITDIVNSISDYNVPPEKCDGKISEVDEKNGVQSKECPGMKFEKVISGGNFQLVGRGWARDGYR